MTTSSTKIALVTGASRGLGRNMAIALARKGVDVIGTYNSNEAEADATVAAVETLGHVRAGAMRGVVRRERARHAARQPRRHADASEVAEAIARVVDMPFGKRPFRVHIDPSQDGAEVVNGVADRVRAEQLRRIGLADLLHASA